MKANWNNTAVIIPVYNSSRYLQELLARITKFTALKNIFIIDDGSTDVELENLVDTRVNLLHHSKNRGKGAALLTGFKAALKKGYKFAITIDSDLQHKPEDLECFLQVQNEAEYDLVIGKRDFDFRKMPWPRILSNSCSSRMVSKVAKKKIADTQSGYRLYHLKFLQDEEFVSQRYQFETEVLLRMLGKKANIGYVKIETIYGEEKSNISHLRDIWNFLKILKQEKRRRDEYFVN
ncbi:MAG: glycosyltransferase family 2 protein [Candidatus Cloacimonadota bacterium]|nr:glycosyltransferase family 2 protein [Candidatus Cloacimonadota bacterium]